MSGSPRERVPLQYALPAFPLFIIRLGCARVWVAGKRKTQLTCNAHTASHLRERVPPWHPHACGATPKDGTDVAIGSSPGPEVHQRNPDSRLRRWITNECKERSKEPRQMNMRARACTKPQSRKDYNPRSLSEVTVMTTRRALMQGAAALAHARASDLVPGSDTTEARSHMIQLEGGGARGRRRRICTESRRLWALLRCVQLPPIRASVPPAWTPIRLGATRPLAPRADCRLILPSNACVQGPVAVSLVAVWHVAVR